jgi:hypothetical protein
VSRGARATTSPRSSYRPGEICQFDVWQPRAEVAVGHGQARQGWVVIACLGYSRAGAGVLVFMLVSRRYERASLIVTSNKPFSA